MSEDITQLKTAFENKSAKIGVIGLGYVGLPLGLTLAENGFSLTGFDIDASKIQALSQSRSYISHIENDRIKKYVESGLFVSTSDFANISDMDAILICVPTPLTHDREPDLSFVVSTAEAIFPFIRAGQLIVLESTTYPGTCREVLLPLFEQDGLKSGQDFFLAYSPEREDPGNPNFGTSSIPKVVGGDGEDAQILAVALYNEIVVETVPVSSMDVAEAVKLTENIYRSVNIALVNELKVIYDKMGIDVWEVIEAAKTKPFGFMPFYPGPGLGGHCIPIDPFYLTWRARQFGQETKFIELAGEINTAMPNYVVDRLIEALKDRFDKAINGASILLIGLAYKKNVNDIRESPAFALIELLETQGAKVDYFDQLVPEIPVTREHAKLAGRQSIEWSTERIGQYDAALICTDHDDIDFEELVESSHLVIDSRNATENIANNQKRIIKA
jgi:UDP-N-acetyl-D-glucosamine dehydrogenase